MLYAKHRTNSFGGREGGGKEKEPRKVNREMAYVMPGLMGSIAEPGADSRTVKPVTSWTAARM